MKKNSVSRRDFLAASGVSLATGLSTAKAVGENPPAKPAIRGAPWDKDPRGSPPFYPTAHFDKDNWQRKILD